MKQSFEAFSAAQCAGRAQMQFRRRIKGRMPPIKAKVTHGRRRRPADINPTIVGTSKRSNGLLAVCTQQLNGARTCEHSAGWRIIRRGEALVRMFSPQQITPNMLPISRF